MDTVTISNLKVNPAKVIRDAEDLPIAIKKRDKVKAYLVGKDLYEKLVSYIEDYTDTKVVSDTNFSKGQDFENVAKDLGI